MTDIQSFCSLFACDAAYRKKSRVLVLGREEAQAFKNNVEVGKLVSNIRVSGCIYQNTFLPSPEKIWELLDEKIKAANEDGKVAVVIGLEAMLSLWSHDCQMRCLNELRRRLDCVSIKMLVVLRRWDDLRKNCFSHPKYKQGGMLVEIGALGIESDGASFPMLISNAFKHIPISGIHSPSFKHYVHECENETLQDGKHLIYVDFKDMRFAGVSQMIKQVYSLQLFLETFFGVKTTFSEEALKWLKDKIVGLSEAMPLVAMMQHYFFPNGLGDNLLSVAPEKICKQMDSGREVLVWMLRETVDEKSYLHYVLSEPKFSAEKFLEFYACAPLNLLREENVERLAEERKCGLEKIGKEFVSGEIAKFISLARKENVGHGLLMPWLNLQTQMEKTELVRFHIESERIGVADAILKSYPLLADYLSLYDLGDNKLNEYFKEYRRAKLQNKVLEDFCRQAEDIQFPIQGIKGRDELLQAYSGSMDTGLLVVDALGAEYMPLILALAKKRSLGISESKVAEVRLPTSTEFNPVLNWIEDRCCPGIKELDSIIHNGAELHTKKSFEENFVAQLNVFETKIIPAIINALTVFNEVILTADHGASRLAVCAYNQGLAKTLPIEDKGFVEDWRYAKALPNRQVPDGLVANLSGSHWIVKGYNRLPKQGGKLYELHGGLTYEECLVPFIVFNKDLVFSPNEKTSVFDELEFVENDDFNDL